MKNSKWIGRAIAAGAMLCTLRLAGADDVNNHDTVEEPLLIMTAPSHTVKPSFMEVGIIREWLVKPGDVVKKGQLLGREDTDLDELQLKGMKIEAESTAEIDAAVAARDSAKIEYDNKLKGYQQQAASESEVQEAKLAFEKADAEIRYVQAEHEKKVADAEEQEGKIAKMQLFSPVNGTVEKINIQEGEIFDPNKPDGALTVVTNTPLWIDVPVPSVDSLKLKVGDQISVAYSAEPDKWMTSTIVYMDPQVIAASDKQIVRLELNNDDNKPAGLWVNVRLPSQAKAP
jgi:HlyD family secretion protein